MTVSVSGDSLDAAPDRAPVERYATRILLGLHSALTNHRIRRLKLCANDACRWAFWDLSRPGTGKWCSMQVCGGRSKAREYRRRRRAAS